MAFLYQAQGNGLSVVDTGDIFQLRVTLYAVEIHEVRVFQTSDTVLAMNAVRIARGTGGNGGSSSTRRELNQAGPSSICTAWTLPTTDVGTLTADITSEWNILQEFVYLPAPADRLVVPIGAHLSVSLLNADALTVGVNVIWRELR